MWIRRIATRTSDGRELASAGKRNQFSDTALARLGRGRLSGGGAARHTSDDLVTWNFHLDLERREGRGAIHLHEELLRIEFDMARDGREQFVAQDRHEIAGSERRSLVREQDLELLPRDGRSAARLEESEQAYAALRLNRRLKNVFFSSGIQMGAVSPARRRAASR